MIHTKQAANNVSKTSGISKFIGKFSFDYWVLGVILLYCIVLWLPTKYLPYHWDSAEFIIQAARKLLDTGFSPLIVQYSDFAHPPLFIILLAEAWNMFGASFLVSHLLILPFLPLLLYATYMLGKKTGDITIGLLSTLLIGISPVVVSEYGQIYLDLPMGSLAMCALTAWVYRRHVTAILFLSLAVSVKFPALLLVPFFALWSYCMAKDRSLKPYLLLFCPLILLIIWFGYHYEVTGWVFSIPGRQSYIIKTPVQWWQSIIFVITIFLNQYRIFLGGITLASTIYLLIRHRLRLINLSSIFLLGFAFAGLLFYITMGEFLLRYSIFFLPAFIIGCLGIIKTAVPHPKGTIIISGVLAFLFILRWHPPLAANQTMEVRPSEDLSYLDHIKVGQELTRYVDINYPTAYFYGTFPQNYQLTQPFQGYTTQPLHFDSCKKFSLKQTDTQFIIVHPYTTDQVYCYRILELFPNKLVKSFEQNGKWIDLYKIEINELNTLN